ncbi:hypothetical protein [Mycobacterium sp. TY813]|uniref:hypothetical protein n=1 Tax=Mycobacterium sp. TY813 TaxID=3050579 RepID=UPI0027405C6E|nr:hypothetical protein [Mycobacterium sp. TY813]MDP7733038.1 hypothetical protein [Mycobacterium sp. TY813]
MGEQRCRARGIVEDYDAVADACGGAGAACHLDEAHPVARQQRQHQPRDRVGGGRELMAGHGREHHQVGKLEVA